MRRTSHYCVDTNLTSGGNEQLRGGRLTDNDVFEQIRVSGHADGLMESGEEEEERRGW